MRTADQVRWGTGGGKRVVPSAKKRGDDLERRPLVGIARERETRADDAALCRCEWRSERREWVLGDAGGTRETVIVPETEHEFEIGRLYGVDFLD